MQELHQSFELAGAGHPVVRDYLRLRRPSRAELRTVAEGAGLLGAVRSHGGAIEAVLTSPELWRTPQCRYQVEAAHRAGAPVFRVSRRTFERLSLRDGQDGVAAIVRLRPWTFDDVTIGSVSRLLVLDGIDLPGNVGSLLRSASAAGAAAVLVMDRGSRLNHPTVLKASVGAVLSVPTIATTPEEQIAWLRRCRFQVVCADPAASDSFRTSPYEERVAIVVGSERHGLSALWRTAADRVVSIPMQGRVDSLNAGHAGALLLFEVAHQQHELHHR